MEHKKETHWMVKHNNQIHGPLTESEVRTKLNNGDFSIFATACMAGDTFWGFIPCYPEFKNPDAVSKITKLVHSFGDFIFTNPVTINPKESTDSLIAEIKKIKENEEIDSDKKHISKSHSDLFTELSSAKPADHHPYKVIKEKAPVQLLPSKYQKKVGYLLLGISVALLGAGALTWFFQKKSISRINPSISLSRVYFDIGDYTKALRIINNKDPVLWTEKDKNQFLLLSFQIENKIEKGEQWLSILNQGNKQIGFFPKHKSDEEQIVQGLLLLKKQKWKQAREIFSRLIENSSSEKIKHIAFSNLALLSAKLQDCQFIDRYNTTFLEKDFNKNLAYFAYSFCLLKSEIPLSKKEKIGSILKNLIEQQQDYHQEFLVGLMYLNYLKKEDVKPLIKLFLNSDPYFKDQFYYPIYIDRSIYGWKDILYFCGEIFTSNQTDYLFKAFYAYCSVQSNHVDIAKKFITEAIGQNPDDILLKSTESYIMESINAKSQAAILLGKAILADFDNKHSLPYLLQAYLCERKKDWLCAVKNWEKVIDISPQNLSALGGLAYAHYHLSHYEESYDYMNRGFTVDLFYQYRPLLFVENQLYMSGFLEKKRKKQEDENEDLNSNKDMAKQENESNVSKQATIRKNKNDQNTKNEKINK